MLFQQWIRLHQWCFFKKGTWHISEYLYYINFLIDLHEDGVAKGDYI